MRNSTVLTIEWNRVSFAIVNVYTSNGIFTAQNIK